MENNIKTPTKGERMIIKFMILLGIFSILYFLLYFFHPDHTGNPFLFSLLTISILYSVLKKLYMWYNYSNITVPERPDVLPDLKVDILTTYYPGEPYQMTITTLEAINQITYPHTAYLCDEADDPYLKQFCKENGIHHVTRDNRINAKAGNINNALRKHATGDICVVLDPDHIPEPNFVDRILPYFEDPAIGFVQIVQSYYNIKESLVARGAAEQTFQFYGPMMMTLNAYGAVNAIGANCVFRRAALDSIGGHAPGLCEDMHTAMLLYSKGWKALYVPEVLARGLAPSNLTNFFKQQLKWSRGTFDLLVKVYPKIFTKLTGRQKIHYGILPFHYLGGIIYFINFLIPVIALFFSITPWEGDVIDFALVLIPVAASSVLIRTFIQKWVIEKKERGFHLVGGLLHINTWWIYIVGLFYTIIDKKVPYLPTPKEDEWNTNLKIIVPNAMVAFISILAIIYGLNRDLTPYSIIMAGFAFFNACIMFFGIYLTFRVTNHNRILREYMPKKPLSTLWNIKEGFYKFANITFATTRLLALPLLLLLLITAMSFKQQNDLSKWENIEPSYSQKAEGKYLGIFHPTEEGGLSDMQEINLIENVRNINFDIISLYLAWNEDSIDNFPHELVQSTYEKDAIPMITWEPWVSGLKISDSIPELREDRKGLKFISEGYFDEYIKSFAEVLKSYDRPVFIRFAHEFDNPQYPWSPKGGNTPQEFVAAWKHVDALFKESGANKVIMVWNPWKATNMDEYYPGNDFVDWIGVTLLNYGPLNPDGKNYSFAQLYEPFNAGLKNFKDKPVMLAEFGSLKLGNRQNEWLENALTSINEEYQDISAIVLFNSLFDQNVPANDWYDKKYLNWTTSAFNEISTSFKRPPINIDFSSGKDSKGTFPEVPITRNEIRGVRYQKGENWRNNYYALTRNILLNDFSLMKEAGINTIQFTGGNIYDYNIITYTKKYDINIIYEFPTNVPESYSKNRIELQEKKESIINKVNDLKENDHVIGYAFNYDLEKYYEKPLLFSEQNAYINWLTSVIPTVKTIDPAKPVVIELPLNSGTISQITQLRERLHIDSFGLIVNDVSNLDEVLKYAEENEISIYISSLDPQFFTEELARADLDIVLENWQDDRRSNWISFGGLISFTGEKKEILKQVENSWTGSQKDIDQKTIRILRPSTTIYPGRTYNYQPVFYSNGEWKEHSEFNAEYEYKWYLVKIDMYGNSLAVKEVGSGAEVEIVIPENYLYHQIMLIAKDKKDGYVISARTNLHTPLNIQEN